MALVVLVLLHLIPMHICSLKLKSRVGVACPCSIALTLVCSYIYILRREYLRLLRSVFRVVSLCREYGFARSLRLGEGYGYDIRVYGETHAGYYLVLHVVMWRVTEIGSQSISLGQFISSSRFAVVINYHELNICYSLNVTYQCSSFYRFQAPLRDNNYPVSLSHA